MIDADVVTEIERLISNLVARRYDALERDGRIGRLTPEEISTAIEDYGKTLIRTPRAVVEQADVYPSDSASSEYAVDVVLWTEEEGSSDLTLSLSVRILDQRTRVSIDDLHVL